jgi:hypothetical protein
MKIKTKGFILIVLGIAGAIFVSTFDIIAGKPKNMIGPKSIAALLFCALLIIKGAISFFKKPQA